MDPTCYWEPGSPGRIRGQRWLWGAYDYDHKKDRKEAPNASVCWSVRVPSIFPFSVSLSVFVYPYISPNYNDRHQVRCDKDRPILEVALQDTECRPYILPLFPNTAEVMMGRNLTWLCKMVSIITLMIILMMVVQVGSSKGKLTWSLPHGQILSEGDCWTDRACVKVHHHDCDDCDDHEISWWLWWSWWRWCKATMVAFVFSNVSSQRMLQRMLRQTGCIYWDFSPFVCRWKVTSCKEPITIKSVFKEGRLTLSFLHPEDVGDYSCTATNAHGNNTRSVYLEVR